VGSIRTATVFTEEMLTAGVSTSRATRHAIEHPRDVEVVGYIFSHLKVVPNLEGYMAMRRKVEDTGVAVGFTSGAACPMQHIMRALMPVEEFFYAMADCPERMEWPAGQMEPYYQSIRAIAAVLPQAHPAASEVLRRDSARPGQVFNDAHPWRKQESVEALSRSRIRYRRFGVSGSDDALHLRGSARSDAGPYHYLWRYPFGTALRGQRELGAEWDRLQYITDKMRELA